MSIKATSIIALAIGALVSAALVVLEPLTDFAFLSWEWPGIAVAYFFWGAGAGSAFGGIAIGWAVNALIYGLGVFAVFRVLGALRIKPKR